MSNELDPDLKEALSELEVAIVTVINDSNQELQDELSEKILAIEQSTITLTSEINLIKTEIIELYGQQEFYFKEILKKLKEK